MTEAAHTSEKQPPTSAQRPVLSVTELTADIKRLMETGFDAVWVKGEVSSFKAPGSGHFYFVLKDEKAVINCVMFRFKNKNLKFQVEDGLEVICGGRITVYEPRGSYQLLIDVIEPVGLGALQLRFEQLKAKLEKEGLFEARHKKDLPALPQKIAIITSPTGAAIRDMLHVIDRRFGNVEILLFPVLVQGDRAAPEIVEALRKANQMAEHEVILLGRGGGSLEDLWAFNEESVARAIFASEIPVISAVGHEVDFTISDFVADLRAPTPSAAAELVVQSKSEIQKNILNMLSRLRQAYLTKIHKEKHRLSALNGRVINPKQKLADWQLRLADLQERLQYTLIQNIKGARAHFDQITPHLKHRIQIILERYQKRVEQYKAVLKGLNPLAILERGYSITETARQKILRKALQARVGETVSVRLFEGRLLCEVKQILD